MITFTICSNNYLPYARVLCKSIKQFHPGWKFVLGLVDKPGQTEWYQGWGFDTVIPVEDIEVPNFSRMVSAYNLVELNTAVKPYFFSHLFETYPDDIQILYFDPDIQVFSELEELAEEFEKKSILLVPHFSTAHTGQSGIITPERRILQRGLYNLGFLGLKWSQETSFLLEWWQDKLQCECLNLPEKGLFVDQKWMDLAPVYFENVKILKDQGYDVAYWNLYERSLHRRGDGIFAGESLLRFYHFSAYDKSSSTYVGNLAERFESETAQVIRDIYPEYHRLLKQNGLDEFKSVECAYRPKEGGRKLLRTIKSRLKDWLAS